MYKIRKWPSMTIREQGNMAATLSSQLCDLMNHVTSLKATDFLNQHQAEEEHAGETAAQGYWTLNCWCQERSFLPSPWLCADFSDSEKKFEQRAP